MSGALILGSGGQLGRELGRELAGDYTVHAPDESECDVTDPDAIERALKRFTPDLVVNCAAHTAVDDCEREPERAFALNARAVESIVERLRPTEAVFVHFSTDYVFDGELGRPYREEDEPNPLSVYGKSKLEGERAALSLEGRALVVRTQWLYGPGGRHFVGAILGKARRGDELTVVDDQYGGPTCTWDLAQAVRALLERGSRGLYHASNSGEASWFDFAVEIVRQAGLSPAIHRCPTDRSRYPAPRPPYGVLCTDKLHRDTGHRPSAWQAALAAFLARTGEVAG